MKCTLLLIGAVVLVGASATAFAGTFTFQHSTTAPNQGSGGALQSDLNYHSAFSWRSYGVNLGGNPTPTAKITFSKIITWNRNQNLLFVDLLDTARNSGFASFIDASRMPVLQSAIHENFASNRFNSYSLVTNGIGNAFRFAQPFTATPSKFLYKFKVEQLQINSYVLRGNTRSDSIGITSGPTASSLNSQLAITPCRNLIRRDLERESRVCI